MILFPRFYHLMQVGCCAVLLAGQGQAQQESEAASGMARTFPVRLDMNPMESLVALLVQPEALPNLAPPVAVQPPAPLSAKTDKNTFKNAVVSPALDIGSTAGDENEPQVNEGEPYSAMKAAPVIKVPTLEESLGFFPDGKQDSLLCNAIRRGLSDAVFGLCLQGADPERVGAENQTALWVAVAHRDLKAIETLLKMGADANKPLNSPVEPGFRELLGGCKSIQRALEKDANITTLMVTAGRGDAEMTDLLMKYGAKPGLYSKIARKYPVNYAIEGNYLYVAQILFRLPEERRGERVVIDLSAQRSTVYRDGKVLISSPVSTGKPGFRTPTGEYILTDKHRVKKSTLYDAMMPFFMRLSCSAIGMHVGNLPGGPASHGCIRMPAGKAKQYFSMLPVGTRVNIVP